MTDMFDSECEEDIDECYNTKHQRRLSDPSANLNNFSKNGWRTTNTAQGYGTSKALSQNEGLDSLANEVWEIEAGDVRDGKFMFLFYFIHKLLALSRACLIFS